MKHSPEGDPHTFTKQTKMEPPAKKTRSANAWVLHVKDFARQNNMKYAHAVTDPVCLRKYYDKKKDMPPPEKKSHHKKRPSPLALSVRTFPDEPTVLHIISSSPAEALEEPETPKP